jgi:exopolyphosphatase/guanosine-5'-triphosphate,3'-diphosphate pyrophosphatase
MRYAIIDIGTNAIRAVVYECNSLSASEVYNEKFRSDLLGLLDLADLDVKHGIYLVIKHFVHIFEELGVGTIKCVATAILRNHLNAPLFVDIVKRKYNIDIEVITGEKEAYLSAAGLIMGINEAEGLAADLGGGSLEIAEIANKQVGKRGSFALGTNIIDQDMTIEEIKNILSKACEVKKHNNLYLIGGAFRMLGRAYMEFVHYPLKNLHNLKIPSNDFIVFLEQSESMYKLKSFHYKRTTDLKALSIVRALIELFQVEDVVISNYGLKEGVRFVNLPDIEKTKDIIHTRCKHLSNFETKNCDLDKYYDIMQPLLLDPDVELRSIADLIIMLSCMDTNIDKIMRGNFMADFALSSDIPFSHKQRVILAVSLSYIFGGKIDLYVQKLARRILTSVEYSNSQIIGCIIRIAYEIDGPNLHKPSFALVLKDKYIEVVAKDILPKQVFDKICDRLRDISLARRVR